MDKIINILKPTGMTSHDVVSVVRRILGTKKVGHTGTLDPDASGVLPICVGKATKVSELILNKEKTYLCELSLGASTDTYDSSGSVTKRVEEFSVSKQELQKALESQLGEIDQLPPVYSALKVNGKRMCDLVRSGREDEIVINPRKVNIKSMELIRFDGKKAVFVTKCSKGTYIRSICNDIGEILGCGAHMSMLIRNSSGKFDIKDSITLEELEEKFNEDTLDPYLYDIDYALSDFHKLVLMDTALKYYTNGGAIDERRFLGGDYTAEDEFVRVYSEDGFIGLGKLTQEEKFLVVKGEKKFI
ncbi:MAG: tRNA pseudouridine(55) synthase TruB [Clostridioides sp.]|jgi:tRNA pseudouridine55 synthase|nr:tRNA pseudouridine(55) synthase TruB [Clostridioides sp.]